MLYEVITASNILKLADIHNTFKIYFTDNLMFMDFLRVDYIISVSATDASVISGKEYGYFTRSSSSLHENKAMATIISDIFKMFFINL